MTVVKLDDPNFKCTKVNQSRLAFETVYSALLFQYLLQSLPITLTVLSSKTFTET